MGVHRREADISVSVKHAATGATEVDPSIDIPVGRHDADAAKLVGIIVEAGPSRAAIVGAVDAPHVIDRSHHVDRRRIRGAVRRLAQCYQSGALRPVAGAGSEVGEFRPSRARIDGVIDSIAVSHPEVTLGVGVDRH